MIFTDDVYAQIRDGARRSAAAVVPILMRDFAPRSVLDVGGGEGWWARAFADLGGEGTVLEFSAPYYSQDNVSFQSVDLERDPRGWSLPNLPDLALCLEVAEHLSARAAAPLVEMLAQSAPVVVFSAAVPGQGGHGHINEQWPEYWVKLFREHDYAATDYLRWIVWNNDLVEPWYRQNLLVFAQPETLTERLYHRRWEFAAPSVVHPVVWDHRRQR